VRRRVPEGVKVPLVVPEHAGDTWSMDFMCDVLMNKRRFRTLNIIDDYNREAIAVEAAYTISALRVTQILERTIHEQGKPNCIKVDNGPVFNSKEFKDWCESRGIIVQFTQPGKPMQNGYIERLYRTFRENILDAYLFEDINQVQVLADEWMEDYNYSRPHEALGSIMPSWYKQLNNK
jgi:putative transposase